MRIDKQHERVTRSQCLSEFLPKTKLWKDQPTETFTMLTLSLTLQQVPLATIYSEFLLMTFGFIKLLALGLAVTMSPPLVRL